MYCILITGIPASGKSTLAALLGERLGLPVISKDRIKELLFDEIGFSSRAEKVKLGTAAMEIMYQTAGSLLQRGIPCIMENNFEHASREGLLKLLEDCRCTAITVTLTGDYPTIYRRFVERNSSPDRHRGHVVNDCYPEPVPGRPVPCATLEQYVSSIRSRGMDTFTANGPHIVLDATDPSLIDPDAIAEQIRNIISKP